MKTALLILWVVLALSGLGFGYVGYRCGQSTSTGVLGAVLLNFAIAVFLEISAIVTYIIYRGA